MFNDSEQFSQITWHTYTMLPPTCVNCVELRHTKNCKRYFNLRNMWPNTATSAATIVRMWFVPKVSVLIFLYTNWQRSTSLMYIGTLVVTVDASPYLFQLDWLSQSCATAVCVSSCFLTSLLLRCRKMSNNGTLSNFVWNSTHLPHRHLIL